MPIDWNAIRAEFPALAHWTYLNTATYGQIPRRSVEAIARHFAHRDELACSDFLTWYDQAECMRAPIARLINATSGDIAFIPNAATALGLVAGGIDWKPGDNVVTLAGEFPNQLYLPALIRKRGTDHSVPTRSTLIRRTSPGVDRAVCPPFQRAESRGAGTGSLPTGGVEFREAPWERFYDSIDARTRLVAISEVNYSTGFRAPIQEISKIAHSRGALVFIDGTQSAGALRFDVQKARPDALAVHAYKWMCGPTGVGFLYMAPELRKILPPNTIGWRSHRDWRNVDNLHHGSPLLTDSAERYEGGGLAFGLLDAMAASVEWMLEIGPEAIEQRVLALAASARDRLRNLGAEVLDNGRSPIVAAKFPGDSSRLARELKARRVLVAARHGFLRVSPHFYNNESDLDRLEEELRKLL